MYKSAVLIAMYITGAASQAAGDSTPPPADVFAKHSAAVGYSLSAGTAAPYVLKSTTKWSDKHGDHSLTTIEKRGGAYAYFTETRDGITRRWGFDSGGFWVANENGNVTNVISYARQFDVTWSIIESEGFDATLNAETRTPTDTDYVIRIHPKSGVPADLYFNKSTSYIDKAVVDPGREDLTETYSDYRNYGQAVFAATWKDGDATTTVTDLQWNAPLLVDDFNRPQQRSYAVFPAGGSTTVSFDTNYYPGVVVKASINGTEGKFLLDTGSSDVLLNPSFARRAKISTHGHGAAEMVGGFSGLTFAQISSFKVGDADFRDFTAVIPDDDIGDSYFDGLLGYDILNQAIFAIDFDAKTLTFYNPASFKAPAAGYFVIGLDEGTPQVQVTVNTKVPVYMDLDLGASGISTIFTKSFLQSNPGIVQGDMRGNGAMMGTLAQIGFGPFQFFGLSAGVLTTDRGFGGEKVLQGLIGYETLRRFNLTFDYQSNKLYLTMDKYGSETVFKRN